MKHSFVSSYSTNTDRILKIKAFSFSTPPSLTQNQFSCTNIRGTRQLRWFNQHNQGSLVVKTMQAYQAIHDIVKSLVNKGILVSLAYSNQEIKTRLQPGS